MTTPRDLTDQPAGIPFAADDTPRLDLSAAGHDIEPDPRWVGFVPDHCYWDWENCEFHVVYKLTEKEKHDAKRD
jgi:hypothetical protein